jgi:DNA-directed RNA polymerase subunit M/transcription elongation factor TFIIS
MTHHCHVCGAFVSEQDGDAGTVYECSQCGRLTSRPPEELA